MNDEGSFEVVMIVVVLVIPVVDMYKLVAVDTSIAMVTTWDEEHLTVH